MSNTATTRFIYNKIVYHVGTLDPANRGKRFSFEGDSLSVSTCPKEWTQIARLGGGKTWELRQEDAQLARFLNMHDKEVYRQLSGLAVSHNLVRMDKAVCVRTQNDGGDAVNELYATREAALENFDEGVVSDDDISLVDTLFATDYLRECYPHLPTGVLGASALNIATVVMASAATKPELLDRVSGLWWNEELDVYAHSAPRGCIFPSVLDKWKVREL